MLKRQYRRKLIVRVISRRRSVGWVELGPFRFRCALGRSGLAVRKVEGDGATPVGTYRLEEVYFRADRLGRFPTGLSLFALRQQDGWCDAIGDRNYNRLVCHPYAGRAEQLWRQDELYEVVAVLSFNRLPRIQGRGSAIFLHVARPGFAPTEGCIAMRKHELVRLLGKLRRGDAVSILD